MKVDLLQLVIESIFCDPFLFRQESQYRLEENEYIETIKRYRHNDNQIIQTIKQYRLEESEYIETIKRYRHNDIGYIETI